MFYKHSCTFLFVLSVAMYVAMVSSVLAGPPHVEADLWQCPRCPFCPVGGASFRMRLRYCYLSNPFTSVHEMPFAHHDQLSRIAMTNIAELLETHIVGQSHVTREITDAMRRKMSQLSEPLVLHLAGDNGVGKTHTARLLSLATSLRCAPQRAQCDVGDNLLIISGTGYDRMPVAEARSRIVQRLTAHQRRYPHGIVLIDDLTAMDPSLVSALAPLFGRAEHFGEQADGTPPLGQLTVVVTTDFGQQGRTWGKSLEAVERMVRDEFATLYGTLVPAYTRTLVFLAFSQKTAEKIVRNAVASLPCTRYGPFSREGNHVPVGSSIDDLAVSFIVERHRSVWEGRENGHALRRAVEDTLLSLVLRYFDEHGYDRRLWARFRLDMEHAQIVLEAHDDLDGVLTVVAPRTSNVRKISHPQSTLENQTEATTEIDENSEDL